jgi:anti-sigma regulatory factor (Ser/Thr protein kinase)
VSDAVLVISELLSNAILHAYPLPGESLQVTWAVDGSSVEVAVSDGGSATVPHAGHPSPSSINGRGLSIVEHLCQTWGIRADDLGLTVWAVVSAPRRNGSGPNGTAPGPVTHSGNGDAGSSWHHVDSVAGFRRTAR